MKHVHYKEVKAQKATEAGAEGCRVRWLISDEDGAPNFYMRRFELEPDGRTPRHTHPWEHEVYVLEGEGTLLCKGGGEPFRAGDVVYIPPGEAHSFTAGPKAPVAFLCMIPKEGKVS